MISELANWKAWQGRIALFPTIPSGGLPLISAMELYKQVWKTDPDNFQKQPLVGTAFTSSVAQGAQNAVTLSCSVQPTRIDFSVSPQIGLVEPTVKLIDDTKHFHDLLANIIAWAGETTMTVNRVGCFAQFATVATSYRAANQAVRSILPKRYALELSEEEDFILQVNHPQHQADCLINFITKWSVERVQTFSLQTGGTNQLLAEHFVAAVSFDNNNVPTTPLSRAKITTLLNAALGGVSTSLHDMKLDIEGF
jgi:hypothetical protein